MRTVTFFRGEQKIDGSEASGGTCLSFWQRLNGGLSILYKNFELVIRTEHGTASLGR